MARQIISRERHILSDGDTPIAQLDVVGAKATLTYRGAKVATFDVADLADVGRLFSAAASSTAGSTIDLTPEAPAPIDGAHAATAVAAE